ncbi:MAG: hypothetical protein QOH86_1386, partial [Sphingomonadales bacterium]|nr:hypothetical protein [Sphingomonadales bacterium]
VATLDRTIFLIMLENPHPMDWCAGLIRTRAFWEAGFDGRSASAIAETRWAGVKQAAPILGALRFSLVEAIVRPAIENAVYV